MAERWHNLNSWYTHPRYSHWMTGTKFHTAWKTMKWRCDNKNAKQYKNWWWRWITYDKKWCTFEWFYEDMYTLYQEWLTLDREDNDWNYCKINCRWATHEEQNNNRRDNNYLQYNWDKLTINQRARKLWINRSTLSMRYHVYKRPIEKVLAI